MRPARGRGAQAEQRLAAALAAVLTAVLTAALAAVLAAVLTAVLVSGIGCRDALASTPAPVATADATLITKVVLLDGSGRHVSSAASSGCTILRAYLERTLRALGFRPQRPTVQAKERDDALVVDRGEARLGADQEMPRTEWRNIAFVDEAGHTFRNRVRRTWSQAGRPSVLRGVSKRREASSITLSSTSFGTPG